MSEYLKKPYEISLWDEKKMWVRHLLVPIRLRADEYKVGKYYSQNQSVYGNIPYTLDYNEYNAFQVYYQLSNDLKVEGRAAEEISIEGRESWKNLEPIKIVKKITKQSEWSQDEKWFWYSNVADKFVEVTDEEKKIAPKVDGIYFVEIDSGLTYLPNTTLQYYKEQKLCVIGSDLMQTPIRAIQPKLTSNVNGSNTLNFSICSKYWDEENSQFFDNPFIKLLVNERKIKLRYGATDSKDCKWYDLVIKAVQEDSETKVFEYTAKDQFVNELSKTGFDIVLDAELENNMGNITTLANTVLEGSDWKVGVDGSILNQTREEPLYKIKLNKDIEAIDMKDDNYKIAIRANSIIYGFYNVIANKEAYFQFLYVDGAYEIDDDRVITNSRNLYIDDVVYNDKGEPEFAESMNISSEYRGNRLVRQMQTIYDATIDKYVYVYKDDNNNKIYGYTESEYLSPKAVMNYVTAPNSYTSTTGWNVGGIKDGETTKYPKLEVQGFPDLRDVEDINNTTFKSLLQFTPETKEQMLVNSGIMDHRSQINGFAKEEEYVFRIKYAFAELNEAGRVKDLTYTYNMPDVKIGFYNLSDGVYTIKEVLFDTINGIEEEADNEGYSSVRLKCSRAVSYSEMLKNRIGLFISLNPVPQHYPSKSYFLEDVQFFKYVTYEKEKINEAGNPTGEFETLMAIPGGELISSVRTKYYYYYPSDEYKAIEDIEFIYDGYEPQRYTQVFNDDQYEKVRSVSARESNRFNLIQTLCETFECWPKFTVEHNQETGEILLDENEGYRQKKWVTFHEYIGKDNYAGFKYGINLKSIQRSLESDEIVSKIVVKDNSNEFAKNGFCSIARATENYIGENFICDFSYYIQQGLLNFNEVNNDLYIDTNGYIGYYKNLRAINKSRESWIEEQAGLAADIPNFEASRQTYEASVNSAQEELDITQQDIYSLTGYYYDKLIVLTKEIEKIPESKWNDEQKAIMNWWKRDDLYTKINKLAQLKNIITQHGALYEKANDDLTKAQKRYDELEELINKLTIEKRALNLQFYKKYSRFIQEGSWINEDYIDENLYYLDAESTLHTSAQPRVSYTINVLEISCLPGYENYKFQLGDKTYMEDTEFFGWTYKDNIKSPYREEIVVTEITIHLDEPNQNAIKVQNYKTQFEDLFQRIAAATQSVTYHTGEYTRAAGIVETNGTISGETLQSSIDNNALRLENAKDQSVVWDETGITTTSLSNTSEIVRLVSGGLFMSNDGGKTWRTGITGNGINANYITTGQLNTGKINIMNGDVPSFRWDGFGLNAYWFTVNKNTNKPEYYNPSKFVRFDQYGIYGISGTENFNPLIETDGLSGEDKIWENANYALTWKGFMLKNDNGSVRISSKDDIQVLEGATERVKIGRLGGDVYGIRISNNEGRTMLETDSRGTLWLRNEMWVGNANSTDEVSDMVAKIGYLSNTRKYVDEHGEEVDTGIHEVIRASSIKADQAFIVYEDGRMIASAAEFTRGCKIGNLTIGEVEDGIDSTRKLDIQSKLGYNFKVEDAMPNPSQLELEAMIFGFTMAENAKVTWYGSTDFSTWAPIITGLSGEANEKFVLTYEDFKNKQKESIYYLKAIARSEQGEDYENYATIMAIAASDLRLVITSSSGNYFKNGIGATVLTAKLFKGGQEIDTVQPYEYTYTWSTPNDEAWSYNGKTLFIEAKDFDFSRTYVCDISKGGK